MSKVLKNACVVLMAWGLVGNVSAALTDIAEAPMVNSEGASVKPNLMFIMDDSGSMDWDYLPDWANDNYCKGTNGSFTSACCRNNDNNGSGNNSCWTGNAPFGNWRGHPPFLASDFNSVYYNPAISYTPPLNADGTSKPSITNYTSVANDAYGVQSSSSINLTTQFPDMEWCTSTAYTDCLRNGNYILPGKVNGKNYTVYRAVTASGSGKIVTGTPDAPEVENRTFGPHYYLINPGEFCDAPNLRNCQRTKDATYSYPTPLRWCDSTANAAALNPAAGSCQALKNDTYKYPRYPGVFFSAAVSGTPAQPAVPASVSFTLSMSGCNNNAKAGFQSVTVNGVNLLSSATGLQSSAGSLASDVVNRINASGKGYTASYSGSNSSPKITITAPLSAGNINHTVSVTRTSNSSNSCKTSLSPTTPRFSGYKAAVAEVPASPAVYPGSFTRVDIVPGQTYPRAEGRTDCIALEGECTYEEEMTNFANWWTYYRTRMQMMKSSASIAFNMVNDRYRVGYFTINNSTNSNHALNIDVFDDTQKSAWYTRLFRANPSGGTPLRQALARAGRIYAGKLNSSTGGADPVQYSCQQNFALLSTDGYWNGNGGVKIDGNTAIGNEDGNLPRTPIPEKDGTNTSGTLADVAAYYYNTDLRDTAHSNCTGSEGVNVCRNNVKQSHFDQAQHQHMTTFTLGLGISGYMQYSKRYQSGDNPDYNAIVNGDTANKASAVCTWQNDGTICNWPKPSADSQANIDDLWHAAVNGHGKYLSAGNKTELAQSLYDALAALDAGKQGTSAAAATSNPNITESDNKVFSSSFKAMSWEGNVYVQNIDPATGDVIEDKLWEAGPQLNTATGRRIYTFDPAANGKLKPFTWDTLTDEEKAYFERPHINTLSQFCAVGVTCVADADKEDAAGQKLVDFLRGDRTNEGFESKFYYRTRESILGDIVSSEVAYVDAPVYDYLDDGYAEFKEQYSNTDAGQSARRSMVYVGANDGMLHAFDAETGAEVWAYVPSMVLPHMYRLADKDYANRHRFYVDATPNESDIYFDGQWRTILVGGLGAGGRGYYALDVTNPLEPKALWEFTADTGKGNGWTKDANLGYTFGRPQVTKLKNGTWVVLVTSGYNNVNPGDGKGYLYVLNAGTGELIDTIGTGAGSTGTIAGICSTAPCPSGLGQISTWADDAMTDNTGLRVYGGDLFGNLWRFDINDELGPDGTEAHLLATLKGPDGDLQPITTKPELGEINEHTVVFVGTGRYLGISDLTDTRTQTLYAIKDPLDTTYYNDPRESDDFVEQTFTSTTCPSGSTLCTAGETVITASDNPVAWATQSGWYVDLPGTGERINTDLQLALGTLTFTANLPVDATTGENADICDPKGTSRVYFLDFRTGAAVSRDLKGVVGKLLGRNATRPVVVRLPNNKIRAIVRLDDGSTVVLQVPIGANPAGVRRVSWRELTD